MCRYLTTIAFVVFWHCAMAQGLRPGFDVDEYTGVLWRSAFAIGTIPDVHLPRNTDYHKVYTAPETGMHNNWSLWLNRDSTVMVLHLRGSTATADSWIENFYAAMIPASGSLQLDSRTRFDYRFAADPKAMVHVGWAVGIASMASDIVQHIRTYYARGIRQILIEGHSQGAALAFLLRSYLYYSIQDGQLPGDLQIKTYCSAGPKPGNQYYAYDYDFITRGGWGFNVVNAADWVPEMPFSIQTMKDLNHTNPFPNLKKGIKKQKLVVRWYGSYVYGRMDRATRKARKRYQHYLGKVLYTQVRKYMKEYQQPRYAGCMNYATAGTPVILQPDADYYRLFPDTASNVFAHHLAEAYYYLLRKEYH
jgi:Lipase (class 3)